MLLTAMDCHPKIVAGERSTTDAAELGVVVPPHELKAMTLPVGLQGHSAAFREASAARAGYRSL